MEKVRLEILGLSASHSQSGSFALVLGEDAGHRRLPIIIGMFEAQAIAVEMENITSNRPMTHDLFKSFAKEFDIELKEVVISNLKEGVFYANLICQFKDGSHKVAMDARPSDAIAIALRFGVAVYTYESVLKEAGVVLTDDEEDEHEETAIKVSSSSTSKLSEMTMEQLNELMDDAINQEDYEQAARVRDELNRRQ